MRPVIDWLLEENQPAVRYHTFKDLLDRPESDPDVRDALAQVPKRGWAAEILQKQRPDGYWETSEGLYRPKYLTGNWQLLVLSDLGLTAEDPRIKKTGELLFKQRYHRDGGFGRNAGHMCSTGNAARMYTRFGYLDDERVKRAFDWLVKKQRSDGGWTCFPRHTPNGTLDCWEALEAYAALPRQRWTRSIKSSAEHGAEFYLEHELWREGRGRYEPWFRFHYPWHYYYDILVGLDALTALDYADDRRLRTALNLLKEKRGEDGKWLLDAVHPDIPPDEEYQEKSAKPLIIENPREPSKWITFLALRVLKRVEGDLPAG